MEKREANQQSTGPVGPLSPADRIAEIDILRAFAVFGMVVFNYGTRAFGAYQLNSAADRVVHGIVRALDFDHTVSLVFAFLIGFGLARGSVGVTVRKLLVLFLIGVLHVFVIGFEVLHMYAVIGLLLLPLRRCSNRTLVIVAVGLVILPVVGLGLLDSSSPGTGSVAASSLTPDVVPETYVARLVRARLGNLAFRYGQAGVYLWWKDIAALWLLGTVAGRTGALMPTSENRRLWRRMLYWTIPVAVVGEAWHPFLVLLQRQGSDAAWVSRTYETLHRWSVTVAATVFGAPALSLVYMAGILLILQRRNLASRLAPLADTGRMALTNYLLQSAMALALFTGVGLGLRGTLGYAAGSGLSLLVFAAEVAFSVAWLRRFRFGPVEWLLRRASYGVPVRNRTPASR